MTTVEIRSVELDPELRAGLEAVGVPLVDDGPPPGPERLALMRAVPRPLAPPRAAVLREDRVIPGPADAPDVAIRVFRRAAAATAPAAGVVWIHGGGFIVGKQDQDAAVIDEIVASTGCVAISVEYRLAPEAPYPAAVEDCFAALTFLAVNASELGVDPSRLAVGGRSAGAGLAAAVALMARDGGIELAHQHLLYPMIDDRQITPSSRWDGLAVWSRELNTFAWQSYLGELYGREDVPAYAAPARATDLRGLPPTYIHIGGLDGFLHETVEYATGLMAAGVPTELHVFPGAPHGFEGLVPDAAVSRAALSLSAAALMRFLGS